MSDQHAEELPDQHPAGDRCDRRKGGCGALLSIYNPYRVCSLCRRRMDRLELPQTWLRGARRPVVRRGPLGIDEGSGVRVGG